jgi:hypothetical protein
MASFAYFRQRRGMGTGPDSYRDLAVNVDRVNFVNQSSDREHSILSLQGEQYTFEVHGRLIEVVEALHTADRYARAGVV